MNVKKIIHEAVIEPKRECENKIAEALLELHNKTGLQVTTAELSYTKAFSEEGIKPVVTLVRVNLAIDIKIR